MAFLPTISPSALLPLPAEEALPSRRLLLVDGEAGALYGLTGSLAEAGYSVDLATTAGQALEQIRESEVDLILLGESLPGMSGLDLLRLLRNGISPDAESIPADKESIPTDEESPLVEEEPAKAAPAAPALRGLAALQAALGDDAEGVVCLIRSDKSMQKRQRVVVLSGK